MRKPISGVSPKLSIVAPSDSTFAANSVLVVGLSETLQLPPSLSQLDQASGGKIRRLIDAQQVRGKQGELSLIASPSDSGPMMCLVVGLGSASPTRSLAIESAAAAIRLLADRPRGEVLMSLPESFPDSMHDAIVAGVLVGSQGQGIYQADPFLKAPESVRFIGLSAESLSRGRVVGDSINMTRRLVNEPPASLYPETFGSMAAEMLGGLAVNLEVWDETRLAAERCRAILAVGAGSVRPPRLVIMRYHGGADEPPIAVVGKGVTFDSGGLSLKPTESMVDMKADMAGAATVVGLMHAIAGIGVRQNVIGICGLAENMVSGSCYKLGDVIETRSGKTIEILNTDAEGRVVLADALDVAREQQPRAIVDLATLTGACMVALGNEVAGLMTNDQSLCDQVTASAMAEGEPVWQLPMFDLYNEKIKSKVADIKNVGEGRWGGAITAAKFLEQFVGDVPWLHMDIAGPAFADSSKPFRDAGATGAMVRTLLHWVESGAVA